MDNDQIRRLEQRVQALEDERAIARLLASYGPLVDAGEAPAAAELWTKDGVYEVDQWLMEGQAAIADMVRSDAHQGLIARGCCHFFGPPLITVEGDDAVAVCQSALLVRAQSGGYRVARAGVHVLSLARVGETWKITRRTARQLDGGLDAREFLASALTSHARASWAKSSDQ